MQQHPLDEIPTRLQLRNDATLIVSSWNLERKDENELGYDVRASIDQRNLHSVGSQPMDGVCSSYKKRGILFQPQAVLTSAWIPVFDIAVLVDPAIFRPGQESLTEMSNWWWDRSLNFVFSKMPRLTLNDEEFTDSDASRRMSLGHSNATT